MKNLGSSLVWMLLLLVGTQAAEAAAISAKNRKYADVQAFMQGVVRNHAGVSLVDIGVNDTGQTIQGVKIGSGPVHNLVVATHHGNEYASTETALATIESLAAAPISGQAVTVIPVLNVPGYDKKVREERGVDPNRDYPGPCGSDEGPFSLKSTKALADYIDRTQVVASMTLHSHAELVLLPWGFFTKDLSTDYDAIYQDLGKAAAIASGYGVGNSAQELYPAAGCYEDYVMWKHGVWSLLIEMGKSHSPGRAALAKTVQENVPGIRRYLEQAPRQRAEEHAFTGKCSPRLKGDRDLRHD